MLALLKRLSFALQLIAWENSLRVAKKNFELAWQYDKDGECIGKHFIYSGARLSGVQYRTSLRMLVPASQPCAITARCKCCQSGNTVGVRACALVDNSSLHVGGARDVTNLSHAGRVRFNALSDAMRAVSGICSYARTARVRLRVHSVTRSLNCCTCAITKRDDVASGTSATHEFSCDVASGASATHEFSSNVVVCSSPKFFRTWAARDATA